MSVTGRVASFICLVLVFLALGTTAASADPVQHFGTFTVQCGDDTLVLTGKPGSSTVVTISGQPSTSVSILMGITVTVNGVVVEEFHKPFTENQDITICSDVDPGPGVTVVAEVLNTPRS